MLYLALFLIAIILWNVIPIFYLWSLPIPAINKFSGTVSLIGAGLKGIALILPNLLAPLVVLVALMQTKYEDNHLPAWAVWWDNDVSINGDQPEDAETYYAKGFDRRGFWARYVWLGWRNRASKLAQLLGYHWKDYEFFENQHWGDADTGDNHEGWVVNRRAHVYQVYMVKRLGRFAFRMNYGHKVWSSGGDMREVANVVNVTGSLISWKGVA